jgi:hypothetical protein
LSSLPFYQSAQLAIAICESNFFSKKKEKEKKARIVNKWAHLYGLDKESGLLKYEYVRNGEAFNDKRNKENKYKLWKGSKNDIN